MISQFFHVVFYQPLYNGLILLMGALPFVDAGIVVVLFTLLVKLLLFPLSQESVKAQLKMKQLEPEIKRLKQKHAHDKEKQAESVVALYRQNKLNPFGSILLIFIQFPIIFSLFFAFKNGLPVADVGSLYSFVAAPSSINMNFLGFVDITQKSILLAILVGFSAFLQMKVMSSKAPANLPTTPKTSNPENDLAGSLQKQMRYMFPVMAAFAAYNISGAIGLYWITSNVFAIGQEIFLRKKLTPAT